MPLAPPPGTQTKSASVAHSSLPARPPPSHVGQDHTTNTAANESRITNGAPLGRCLAFPPRSLVSQPSYARPHGPSPSPAPTPPAAFVNLQASQASSFGASRYAGQAASSFNEPYASSMPAQLHNPFPIPGSNTNTLTNNTMGDTMDPELEAQIAQWQSAYTSKDGHSTGGQRAFGSRWTEAAIPSTGANSATLGSRLDGNGDVVPATTNTDTGIAEVVTGADGKQKTVVRQGGGQTWQDPSLLEWDPAHFRLFVGNLAGEVTDDSLLKAFSKYPSIQKARVVRDKRTTKSKGYGFVSFADGDQYFQAARDMQGKYIGSHPVLLRKSTTEIRPTVPKTSKHRNKRGKAGSDVGGPDPGSTNGVHKKQSKFKNGLRVIG